MQKEKEKNRQYESLKRDINGLLRDFQRNKQWADFSNWLHRVYEELSKKRFAELPQRIILCKRLAQCLNPSLPAGVHTTVLKVYEVILKNFGNKTQMLPLIALGLFPFFEHSNYANKLALVKLFDEHFVNETQSVQMIVGLTSALLTGLNENDEFTKKIYAFFDKFAKNYGKIWVDGAVWINILKSPKVRLAGFKYFMKVFKDRDRVLLNPVQESMLQVQNSQQKTIIQALQNRIDHSQLKEQEKVMLTSLHGYRSRPDQNFTRFPNFSTLIVNTLCVCLDFQAEQMVKRSTLDLLINYLKISTKIFQRDDGVLILEKMLLLLQTKQYNLTNRVYKYLFDQPNAEGQFFIDFQKKSLQLQVLQQALQRLLQHKNHSRGQTVLLIIQIILTDHPILTEFLLTRLSFQITYFIREFYIVNFRKQNLVSRSIQDFYLGVIVKNKRIFLMSIIKIISEGGLINNSNNEGEKKMIKKEANNSIEIMLDILQFYFNRLQKIALPTKQKPNALISQEQQLNEAKELQSYKFVRTIVIQQLIQYTYKSYPCSQKLMINILDLSNQLLLQYLATQSEGQALTPKQIDYIEQMLERQKKSQKKIIYAKLITLLPHPKKQQLLPYIEDSSLSIVCINLLLGCDKLNGSKLSNKDSIKHKDSIKSKDSLKLSQKQSFYSFEEIPLNIQQQQSVFSAIFKLLNCHLFESKALQFIQRFRNNYTQTFNQLIDSVNPSQWLIYWKKVEGNVSGGIIRMLQNLDTQNSYHKHLSRKWIVQSQAIISKVIEPLYNIMKVKERKMSIQDQQRIGLPKNWNIDAYDRVYTLMRLVFRNTTPNFSKFFFLQREKFLNTFIIYIFKCIQTESFETKSKSLQMITFLLDQTRDSSQKFDMVNLTLANVISILSTIIQNKHKLKNSQMKEEDTVLTLSNFQIQLLQYISKIISNINQILKSPQFKKPDQIIKILKNSNIYVVIMTGMQKTETSYIKTLYMDSSKEIAQMIAQLDNSKTEITVFMNKILDQLFSMLKNTEMNTIEDIIRSRNGNANLKESMVRRKKSCDFDQPDLNLSFYQEGVKEDQIRHNLNLQQKYGEIIEIWNAVKFYIMFAIKLQLKQMPVINLISLILQSFPFSYLKYTRAGGPVHQTNLQLLQQEISNVTGLKKEVLQIFQILWNKQSRQILDFLIEKGDPRILVHSSLDPSKVLQTFNKNSKMKQVLKYIRNNKFSLPKNTLHYNFDTLNKQNQLLYFVYVYFLYFNMKSFKNKRINLFFDAFNQFLRAMKSTSHIQSKLWLLQIIELISQRMMISKDVNIQNWSKIKQDIQDITKELLDQIVSIINKSKLFTHKFQIKTGLFGLFGKEEKQTSLYDFIKMFPPSIFESYEKYLQNMKRISKNKEQSSRITQKSEIQSNFQVPRERLYLHILEDDKIVFEQESKIDEYLFVHFLNRSQNEYINYLGLCSLKTLIRIGNSLLINVYDKDINKINLIIRQILINLLPICENRSAQNQHYNELIAQYLHTVLENQQLRLQIIKIMRRNILDIFMTNDFFKCTQKTLFYWKGVIDYCTESYDLLGQLLTSEGLFEGIFTKKAEATRQKIKSFERVCFIIYSGKIDKYENKLRTVLQSINDVMKQENPSPALLILILFCIRILFMRLSAISLNKLFRSVWPSLITLLIQIFKKEKAAKNINLQLAALKVIELVHALELEEFMLHKWMFVFDYFGVRIDPMGDIEDNMSSCQILTPFVFKPFLTNALPNTRLKCKFMPEKSDIGLQKYMTKRRLIVKKTNVESEDQLREFSVLLMQYMMDLNEYRCQISKNDIENLIEDDFISLDDYIFKMK